MNAGTARFGRVAVIGVGLIGGSFALGLKAKGACRTIIGVGRDPANMQVALERGIVDEVQTDAAVAVKGADLVLVATPVAQFPALFARILPSLSPDALLMDAGSTKQDVVAAARAALGARIAQFVPAHPIAGAEHSGAAAAKADLFNGKRVVLAPLAENATTSVEAVAAAWEACGARTFRMSPAEHDAVFAAVSHLPHLVAFALMNAIGAQARGDEFLALAGPGFRDFTRIAASEPGMWCDILLGNREQVLLQSQQLQRALQELEQLIAHADAEALRAQIANASAARAQWRMGGQQD